MAQRNPGYPLTTLRFKLSIKGVDDNFASFSWCSGFSYQQKSISGRFGDGGVTGNYKMLVGYEFSKITFRRGVIEDTKLFDMALRAPHDFQGVPSILDDSTIILTVLKNDGAPGMIWTFTGCSLCGYQLGEMDALRGEVLMESFTFAFKNVERKVPEVLSEQQGKS